jgi:hypothetical protein
MTDEVIGTYTTREVAGVFYDTDALENAVEELTQAGFKDGDFNIMAAYETIKDKLGDRLEPLEKLADDPKVPRKAFLPRSDIKLAKAAAIGLPMYILGLTGALATVASGGAAALAIAAAAAGGTLGAGIGAGLAKAIDQARADELADEMIAGGIVLWVNTPTDEKERLALDVLTRAGGKHVHAHEITRDWRTKDLPLADFNPDPFLEPDPL